MRDGDLSSSSEPEIELEELNLRKDISQSQIEQFMIVEKEVAKHTHDSLASSQKMAFCKDLSASCSHVDTLPTMEAFCKNNDAPLEEGMETCIPKLPVDDGRKSTMSMVSRILKV